MCNTTCFCELDLIVPKTILFSVTLVLLLQILPHYKNFLQKSKCTLHPHTRCHLCTKFGLLSPESSFGEKTVSQPDTHPAYFAMRVSQCGALRNKMQPLPHYRQQTCTLTLTPTMLACTELMVTILTADKVNIIRSTEQRGDLSHTVRAAKLINQLI